MRDGKQLSDSKTLLEASSILDINILLLLAKLPLEVAKEIDRFRREYVNLNLTSEFYTYDLYNMATGVFALNIIKQEWERSNSVLAVTHEVTLSVYPAMGPDNLLNFYFIPTWLERGAFNAGKPIQGKIIDFANSMLSGSDIYENRAGYIYDLGSSCP